MTTAGILTLLALTIMFVFLMIEKWEPLVSIFATLMFFLIAGILTPTETLAGFSNEGIATIAALSVLVYALQKNPSFLTSPDWLLGNKKSVNQVMARLTIFVSSISALMNNTPIVLLFTPVVKKWALKAGLSPSKLLIPLSYAAILGGMVTLIGTSTNLIVSAFLTENGYKGFSLFDFAFVGIPCAVVGILYLVLIGDRLLPEINGPEKDDLLSSEEFLFKIKIDINSTLIGRTIYEARLRNLKGAYLIAVIRKEKRIFPIPRDYKINGDDILIFTGVREAIGDFELRKGLNLDVEEKISLESLKMSDYQLFEVEITKNSALANRKIKEVGFKTKYQAVVITIYRNGKRINSKLGETKLMPGDTMFILANPSFFTTWKNSGDFYFCHDTEKISPTWMKTVFPVLIFLFVLFSVSFGFLPILTASFLAVLILLTGKVISVKEINQAIDWNLLLLIGFSFGIGKAIENSGLADYFAIYVENHLSIYGPYELLILVYVVTMIVTQMITNNAAVILLMPIVLSIIEKLALNPEPFAMAVAIAASSGFSTPFGYQTNLIVYGPGRYRFKDYLKIGLPLTLLIMIVALVCIPYFWEF
jgi:di/tricarboxylate transporter